MNTNNKTVREKAMYYWNQQISEFGQYTLTSTHYPDRHPLSLTGREIEKIYLSEHPEENEETKFSKHWWNGLNYRTRKELADAYTDNSGSVDAALMMDDETIERIYQSEHPKEQTKGVIEGLDFKRIELIAEQFRINEGFTDDANISFCSGFYKGQKWFNDTHYMPLLEELNKMKQSFYMDICRAYNAGKANMKGMVSKEDLPFVSSHDYFKGEFPEFETNVP